MARLSTHVLDTLRGKPAGGVEVRLYAVESSGRRLVKTVTTNTEGRTDEPLLSGSELCTGIYELVFRAGDYFRSMGDRLEEPPFLDEVTVRFGVADGAGHYHVPLLIAPYAYSTYRGS
jgi:5-hydroxyisourate hydrolase